MDENDTAAPGIETDEPVDDPYDQYEVSEKANNKTGEDLEDEEFLAAFEKMCNESVQVGGKALKSDLPVPMSAAAKNAGTKEIRCRRL